MNYFILIEKYLQRRKINLLLYIQIDANVENSFVATGCVIEGTVKNSIIFRKVHVKEGAVIENSIIMQNCIIEERCTIRKCYI